LLIDELALDRAEPIAMNNWDAAIAAAAVVVNATPADLPAPGGLHVDQRLFDLRSRRSPEGRSMLLHQGADAFEIWTGKPAPLEVMRVALEQAAGVAA
jgi:shikimate 5-dehydrogenase